MTQPASRLNILVDLDGIVTDLIARVLGVHAEHTGERLNHGAVTDYEFKKCPAFAESWERMNEAILSPGFFRNLEPIPGALEGVRALHERHTIAIITALPHSGAAWTAAEDKLRWCAEHLPFIAPHDIIFASSGKKHHFVADVLIDDHPQTLRRYAMLWPHTLRLGIAYNYNAIAAEHADLVPGWADLAGAWRGIVERVEARARKIALAVRESTY